MDWSESDLNIKFLMAEPIELNGVGILKPLTIDEIMKIGFSTYNQYLSILCLSNDDIHEMLDLDDDKIIEPFDFISGNCMYGNEELKNQILCAIGLFLREDVGYFEDYFSIGDVNEGRYLHKLNYNFFVDILKQMNCISNAKKERFKPRNDAEKEFMAKLKGHRSKNSNQQNETKMSDIISAVCAKHPSINIFNVRGLTIFQLINQFKRLEAIDSYSIQIESMLHGCSGESMDLKHWSGKL